jgi:hypothetical protein
MTAMSPELLKLFKAARHWGIWVFTLLAVGPLGLAQREPDWPNSQTTVAGSETVLGYTLSPDTRTILGTGSHSGEVLLRLPSVSQQGVAELAGMLQQGADIEVFMVWQSPGIPQGFDNHIEIFRGRPGTEAALVHDFTLLGGPGGRVSFFQPPDARDSPKVLIDIYAGTTYWTTYLLAPDRQSVEKLFDASGYEFADLDGDGVYELIVWDGRWSDSAWCIDLFGFSFYPRIFVRDGAGYQMAWPLPGEANFRVAAVHDLRGDGVAELIVLQDRVGAGEPTTPAVAVYKLDQKIFRLVAEASLPAERIAFTQIGFRDSLDGKEVLVRTAFPAAVVQPPDALARANAVHLISELAQCDPEGPGTTGAAYILRADRLEPVQQ